MHEPEILYRCDDGVGTITLNRPQARNALTFAMYEEIARICADPAGHGGAKVLVLTGAGDKAFAAGTDIAQFRDFRDGSDALAYEAKIERILTAIETASVPTIAAIAGAATGGGAAIAACCDLRIATADAKFGFPIARTLGNCLSVGNLARLAGLMGPGRVKEMIFTARLLDAEECARIGLYGDICPDHATLMERAAALARTIAGHAPLTLSATKEGLRRIMRAASDGVSDDDLIVQTYMSADFREGIEAFLAKRKPAWTGR